MMLCLILKFSLEKRCIIGQRLWRGWRHFSWFSRIFQYSQLLNQFSYEFVWTNKLKIWISTYSRRVVDDPAAWSDHACAIRRDQAWSKLFKITHWSRLSWSRLIKPESRLITPNPALSCFITQCLLNWWTNGEGPRLAFKKNEIIRTVKRLQNRLFS